MPAFDVTSADGTRIRAFHGGDPDGVPVVVSNGLGTPPEAWPRLFAAGSGFRAVTWYYRGTGGGERPAGVEGWQVRVEQHVDDLLATMDAQGVERALVAAWSVGVNVAFEAARRHPDRVAGLLAVAGVPGGTFEAMLGAARVVPRPLRHPIGVAGARLGHLLGPALSAVTGRLPVTRSLAHLVRHSGFVLPAADVDDLVPALEEFGAHDFRWYFGLALGMAEHAPMDLSWVACPVTLVSGRWDLLTYVGDMERAARQLPHARVVSLPGSHFLPLEYPDELMALLEDLAATAGPVSR